MYIPIWFIIVVIVVAFFYYIRSRKKNEVSFMPFRIHIMPNWYLLLKDYKLIDEEGWNQLGTKLDNDKNAENNILRTGIHFTVLESDIASELIYYNTRKSFHSSVDFKEEVEYIKFKDEGDWISYSPDFWVQSGLEGYEIGITTPESRKKVFMAGDENDLVKIAVIPYCLFHMPRYRFGIAEPKQIEEKLKKNGWLRDETIESLKADTCYRNLPEVFKHKYFELYCGYI